MGAYIIADKREREVMPHLEALLGASPAGRLVQHQVNTGDFLMCRATPDLRGGHEVATVACFERKTIKDFVSSLRDGRYEGERAKMLELRAQTGCQLYFIVEGPAFPNPDWKVGSGMAYSTLLRAMTTLPLASGIGILQTADARHTAERLRDFVAALDDIPDPFAHPAEAGTGAACPLAGTLVPELITGRYEKDPDTHCMEMWARLAGISVTTGKLLAGACSVAEFVRGGGPDPAALKGTSGKLLVKRGRESLLCLRRGDPAVSQKLLSGVPDISFGMAGQIMAGIPGGSLKALCSWGPDELGLVPLAQKGRTIRLGRARAEKILRLFNWRSGAAPNSPIDKPKLFEFVRTGILPILGPAQCAPLPAAGPALAPAAIPPLPARLVLDSSTNVAVPRSVGPGPAHWSRPMASSSLAAAQALDDLLGLGI